MGQRIRTAEELRVARQALGPLKHSEFGTAYLEVPGGNGHPLQLYLADDEFTRLETVDKNQVHEIRYWYYEERRSSFDFVFGRGKLESIRNEHGVIVDHTICRRHNETMTRQPVPICYGLPMREFMEAANRDFPNAAYQLGGCVVMNDSPQDTPAYVCATCEAAYQAWVPTPSQPSASDPTPSPSEASKTAASPSPNIEAIGAAPKE